MTTKATTRRTAVRELERTRAALGAFCRADQDVSDAAVRAVLTLRDAVEKIVDLEEELRKLREVVRGRP